MIDPAAVAARLWPGSEPLTIEASTAGGNNRLFRVSAGGERRALKFYPSQDGKARLRREETALRWLREDPELAPVPAFYAADPEAPAALIAWMDGSPVGPAQPADVDAAIRFALRLALRRSAADALPLAAEATPTSQALADQIETRLARPRRPEAEPLVRSIAAAYAALGEIGAAPAAALIPSPSDFGFHNALRLPGGGLGFLDFEYFGCDDPVRLAGDFILHPGMWPPEEEPSLCPLRRRFMAGIGPALNTVDSQFEARLRRQLPFLALRWALIVLNPLDPSRPPVSDHFAAAQRAKSAAFLAFATRSG